MTDTPSSVVKASVKDFLSALLGKTTAHIRLVHGDTTTVVGKNLETALTKIGKDAIYLSPVVSAVEVPFLYSFTDHSLPDQWQSDELKPTAVLFKDGGLICVYALKDAVAQADAAPVANAMNGFLDDPIPTPGANGWDLVHLDAKATYTFETLAEAWSDTPAPSHTPAQAASVLPDLGKFRDATIRRAFDETDAALLEPVTVMRGAHFQDKRWKQWTAPRLGVLRVLCDHLERPEKDGPALVFASFEPGERQIEKVESVSYVGLDIDTGFDGDQIAKAILDSGLMAVLASTHSHLKTTTVLAHDPLVIWMDKTMAGQTEITLDVVKAYLTMKGVEPDVVASAEFEIVKGKKNREVVVTHAPLQRWRAIFPLDKPFVISENGRTDRDGRENWRAVPTALAKVLGDLPLDRTGSDPNRLFYTTGHAPGAEWRVDIFGGKLLNADDIIAQAAAMPAAGDRALALVAAEYAGKVGGTVSGPFDRRWASQYAAGFEIADLIRDFGEDDGEKKVRGQNGKFTLIKCPFHEDHSEPDSDADTACAVVNASDNDGGGFSVGCQHNACKHVNQRDRLDYINKMDAEGWFTFEQAMLPAYNPLQTETQVAVNGAAAGSTFDDVKAAIEAVPPKTGVDPDPFLAMIARIESLTQRESLMTLLKSRSNVTVPTLRKAVAGLRKAVVKVEGDGDDLRTDPVTGMRTFVFRGEPNDLKARAFLMDTMLLANQRASNPVFTLNGNQVMSLRRNEGRYSFEALTSRRYQAAMFRFCTFAQHVEEGELNNKIPDTAICNMVFDGLDEGELPRQPTIRRAPSVGPDGSIRNCDGWFDDVLVDLGDLEAPDVPADPTPEQVQDAVKLLVDDLLGDFPFDDDDDLGPEGRSKASEANAVAMIVTQFARDLFRGPSPLFTIIKPSPGVGGTLLAEIPQRLFDGAPSSTLPFTRNDDEMQKLLVSLAVDDGNFAFFDNVPEFNSDAVKRQTTSERISGRYLGTSRLVSRPNNILWQVTGINPRLGAEISRRSAFISLNSRVANNRRREYRHADFKGWLGENRTKIIGAILTLIRAWWVAGAQPGKVVLASFESWAKVIGGVLEHAGIEGFLTNPRDEEDDEEGTEMNEFAAEWLGYFKDTTVSEKQAFDTFNDDGAGAFIAGYGPQRRGNFRQMVNGLKGKVFEIDDRMLMFERVGAGSWRLKDIGAEQ